MKYLFTDYNSVREAKLLRQLLYTLVIAKCVFWLIDFDVLFGLDSIIYKNNAPVSFIKIPAFWLFKSGSDSASYLVLISTVLITALSLFTSYFSRVSAFAIWFLILNIDNKIYPTLSGADFLLQQLLFFNIFLSNFKNKANEIISESDRALHNAGVTALKIQICLVYFISGLAKLMDSDWQNGLALSQTFLVQDFSLPFYYNHIQNGGIVLKITNYVIIAYQLMFPVLIWIKKFEKPLLAFGILQHLFIALFMGLPSFGFIMIIAYSIFYAPVFKSQNSL